MSDDRDNVHDIVSDMEDQLTMIDTTIEAFYTVTGKWDDGDMQGGVPYPVCIVLSENLRRSFDELRDKWRRLHELTRPEPEPGNVERLGALIREDLADRRRGRTD